MAAPIYTSTITFDRFNLDPLPPAISNASTVDFAYGDVVGGDAALQSRDGDQSYVRYYPTAYPFQGSGFMATQSVITMRGTANPPIPATAVFPTPYTVTGAFQVRLEDPGPGDSFSAPYFMVIPVPPGATPVLPDANGWLTPFAARSGSDPAFGTTWWDEQHDNSTGTGPQPDWAVSIGDFLRALDGGYFLIAANNGIGMALNQWVRISYVALSIQWQPPTASPLRMTQRDDGLGIHAHPRLALRNGPSSAQAAAAGSAAPRLSTANRYQ